MTSGGVRGRGRGKGPGKKIKEGETVRVKAIYIKRFWLRGETRRGV